MDWKFCEKLFYIFAVLTLLLYTIILFIMLFKIALSIEL